MKNNEEGYSGESVKLFEFNKRIVIKRESGEPYLIRRTLFSFKDWFSIKIHKIVQSDEACSHDHPWPFWTFILKGGYFEWTPLFEQDNKIDEVTGQKMRSYRLEDGFIYDVIKGSDGEPEAKRWHGPKSFLYRPATWKHRLQLKQGKNGNLIPAITLVFTGKVIRDWGFFTSKGWIFWKDYSKEKHC